MADFVIAAELSLRDRLTTPLRGVVRSMQDLTRGADRASEAIDEIGASSSAIDSIDTSGARAEMKQLEASADQASDAIRTIADPKIDGSQAKKELQGIEKEAKSLRSTLENLPKPDIAGGVGTAGQDLISFTQMVREYQASLGVTEEQAQQLTNITKDTWAQVQGITKEEAFESVRATSEYFDLQGEAAERYAAKLANLRKTGIDNLKEINAAVRALDGKFEDIKGPEHALNMLIEARQRMSADDFDEMLDPLDEYSTNFSSVGFSGNDYLSAMVESGEKGRFVMDRLGDSLANDLIAKIRNSDKGVMNALDYLWSVQSKKGFDSEMIEKLHDKSGDWEKALKEGGKAAKQAQKEMEKFGIDRKALKEYDELTNKSEAWREAIVKGGEDGEKAVKEILSTFTKLDDKAAQWEIGSGLLGTLFEEQGASMLPVMENLSKKYRQLGEDTTELDVRNEGFLNQLKTKWKEVMGSIGGEATDTFGGFTDLLGASLPAIGAFIGARGLGGILPTLSKIGSYILRLGPWVLRFAGPWGLLIAAVTELGVVVYENWEWIERRTDELITGMKKAWNELGPATRKVWEDFKTDASSAFGKAKEKANEFFSPLFEWLDGVQKKWDNLVDSISNFKMPDLGTWITVNGEKETTEVPTAPNGYTAYAWGGILTRPHIGMVAEDGPEAVIPLGPDKRGRGFELWQQAGKILGVQQAIPTEQVRSYATGAVTTNNNTTTTTTKHTPVHVHYHASSGQTDSEFQRFFKQLKSSMQNM
ncbi:hypothetical protein [Aneurinibacillus aneurinilyticus]|uniref:hypothetical protein n=1 Tax=Aneurinibacillus aneurinilyticus TaxID=1391 RepID=UPI0036732175